MDPREKKGKKPKKQKTKKQKKLKKTEKTKTSVRNNVRKKVREKVRRKIQTYPPHYILDERQKNWKKNRKHQLQRPHEQKTKKQKQKTGGKIHKEPAIFCVYFWEQP